MDTEIYWRAVAERDGGFDGVFLFAVETTGIYCRPSCPAKRPKRENVRFFSAADDAEMGGFRPCLRCRPNEAENTDTTTQAVISACREIDNDPEISLIELAEKAGVGATHFQRRFKQIIGVSPKKYAEAVKTGRFRKNVRLGIGITDAMYAAGFGSSRALYENTNERLGMTPAIYQKGGKGMKIDFTIAECSLGLLLVAGTERGICSVTFGDSRSELEKALFAEFPNAAIKEDDKELKTAVIEMTAYLDGKRNFFDLPLDLRATAFQLQIWEMLAAIPYGETRTYKQIAAELGDVKKVRAVARACATNRIAVLIPCHRVIASDGKLSGYRWGLERKRQLIEIEKNSADSYLK